jgi:hypothetical protein
MTTPIILTLDLGTTTGWALQHTDACITSGSQSFKPHRFEGGGMRYLRFKHFYQVCDFAGFDPAIVRQYARVMFGGKLPSCH